jgi:hypothetical protein
VAESFREATNAESLASVALRVADSDRSEAMVVFIEVPSMRTSLAKYRTCLSKGEVKGWDLSERAGP